MKPRRVFVLFACLLYGATLAYFGFGDGARALDIGSVSSLVGGACSAGLVVTGLNSQGVPTCAATSTAAAAAPTPAPQPTGVFLGSAGTAWPYLEALSLTDTGTVVSGTEPFNISLAGAQASYFRSTGGNSEIDIDAYSTGLLRWRSGAGTNQWAIYQPDSASSQATLHFQDSIAGVDFMTAAVTTDVVDFTQGMTTEKGNLIGRVWAGASATIASSGTDYISFGQGAYVAVNATAANAYTAWPVAGTASNLQCFVTTAAQAGGVVYTVYGGSAGTSAETLTCTMTNVTTPVCSDTTHTFAVAAADKLSIKVVNSNAANATGVTSCSFVVN